LYSGFEFTNPEEIIRLKDMSVILYIT
jgi:hypothetical protein